jgi:hypothetical protein
VQIINDLEVSVALYGQYFSGQTFMSAPAWKPIVLKKTTTASVGRNDFIVERKICGCCGL